MTDTPALDLLEWVVRHQAGLFYVFIGSAVVYLVGSVIVAIGHAREQFARRRSSGPGEMNMPRIAYCPRCGTAAHSAAAQFCTRCGDHMR